MLKELKDTLYTSLIRYCNVLMSMEACTRVQRFRLEAKEYQELLQQLDSNRRVIHSALMANLVVYCRTFYKQEGKPCLEAEQVVALGGISNRNAVARWAVELGHEMAEAQLNQ